jgi:AraC-like DNA-binding protein
MLSHDPSHSHHNPFHCHLLPGPSELIAKRPSLSHPPIPFLSPNSQKPSPLYAVFQLCLPDLELIALEGPACEEGFPESRLISAIFIAQGEVCVEYQSKRWCCSSGDCLIVNGSPLRWVSKQFSVVCLMFPRHQQEARIQHLHSQLQPTESPPLIASSPVVCRHGDGEDVQALIGSLGLLLSAISDLQASCPLLLPHLRMGDQLGKLTAMLAIPELRQASIKAPEKEQIKPNSIPEHLIDYIDSHLADNLSLSVLEEQSHYSRRALQYAFRARYGCTLTQWIRARRLDLAHKRLSLGAADDSVGDIARACGYRSMSLFSIEFQQRFHVKPSALLREARAHEAMFLSHQPSANQPEHDDSGGASPPR